MYYDIIKSIERKYEYKRNQIQKEHESKKKELYDNNSELYNIDQKIKLCGIEAAKMAISGKDGIATLKETISKLKKEKEALLKKLSFSDLPEYTCKKCLDTGYVIVDNKNEMCNCFKQEVLNESYNRSNLHNLKNATFDKFNLSLYSGDSDPEKYGTSISPKDNIDAIKKYSYKFIDNFDSDSQKNLLFTGTPGSGKTFLSSCIANELMVRGRNVLYQTAPLLFDSIFEYKYSNKSSDAKELYDTLFDVDLLIIDDLGTENITDARITELFNILNVRLLNSSVKTIISTNLTLQKLVNLYDLRIMSRILGNYDVYKFFGDDIRLKS